MTGKHGKDVFIRLPCGVVVSEIISNQAMSYDDDYYDDYDEEEQDYDEVMEGEEEDECVEGRNGTKAGGIFWEEEEGSDPCDPEYNKEDGESPARSVELTHHNQIFLVARGGSAGLGNLSTKSSSSAVKSRKPTLVSIYWNYVLFFLLHLSFCSCFTAMQCSLVK